ncbi:hypothetical protein FJ943_02525 [Mesorhizobium sp. B2-3-10]|nr:hypothetical protein FJ943_02525 [Mesorhizobium sp. B2-3-10]
MPPDRLCHRASSRHGYRSERQKHTLASLSQHGADDHDALVLPGGAINPDLLRVEQKALDFITSFWPAKNVAGAIRHAPWLLVETGIAKGRRSGARHQPVISMRSATKRSVSVWYPRCRQRHPRLVAFVRRSTDRTRTPRPPCPSRPSHDRASSLPVPRVRGPAC